VSNSLLVLHAEPEITGTDQPTVLVDRDGVINVNRPDHVKCWSEFAFLPGALDGLALFASHGWRVLVLTNQAVVNRGLLTQAELDALHVRMIEAIETHGGRIAAVLVCPRRPDEGCGCRKPGPGLLLAAESSFGVRLSQTLFIGDHENDLQAAAAAGCSSLLVLSGRTRHWVKDALPESCLAVVPDLLTAARQVVAAQAVPILV